MKALLLLVFLGIGSLAAAEDAATPSEAVTALMKPLQEGGSASEEQYDAFRELVREGPDGWDLLVRALSRTDNLGDAARKIDCLWDSSGMPDGLVDRFLAAKKVELARRASNETWALLYAGACIRTERRARGETVQEQFDRCFSAIGKCLDRPAEALVEVAFLRVRLVEEQDFPGHRFAWNEKPEKQKAELQGLLEWWKKHRDEFKVEE